MEKRRFYYFILSLLTVALIAIITFNNVNNVTNWVDLSQYTTAISYLELYGPITLLCLFAFGSLFGKMLSKIVFVVLFLILIVFAISIFAPQLIEKVFNSGTASFLLG